MWICKHCNKEFDFTNTSEKANHSRWCDSNPKLIQYKNNKNISKKIRELLDNSLGPITEFCVKCHRCQKDFLIKERSNSFPKKEKYFCSRSCANTKVVNEKTKEKIRESINDFYIQKGIKPDHLPVKYKLTCNFCGVEFNSNRKKYKFCSKLCLSKHRTKNIDNLPTYRRLCAFKFNLADFPDEFHFDLIKEHGWYKPKNKGDNLGGISRDHIISVRYGFDNKIDPKIISHPANCRLMKHSDNVTKYTDCDMSIKQLLEKIKLWEQKYDST